MCLLDWLVMGGFAAFIVIYGTWKTGRSTSQYLLANRSRPWFAVTLSVMATQASAITFLSTPGQGYTDGMRFVQFYLGLPIAMIILCFTAVPLFHKLKVFTAYEFLEQRFDLKNRLLGAILFLIQRGLATGFTILAPALILSILLKWDLKLTIIAIGALVVIYTSVGGSEAVGKTHMLNMAIITLGMAMAFILVLRALPHDISTIDALQTAGKLGKMNVLTFNFDWRDRYTFWSGLIGGTFLALSYFGTDQSQVARYLTGRSIKESRIGLLANGIIKIPMQFTILLLGVMVFVYYQFATPPLFFNPVEEAKIRTGSQAQAYIQLENEFANIHAEKQMAIRKALAAPDSSAINSMRMLHKEELRLRREASELVGASDPGADSNDTNYIFLHFVISTLPKGLVGLILAAILAASMSSTSAELNALTSTTTVDIYKRLIRKDSSDRHFLFISRLTTVFWGAVAVSFGLFVNAKGSLVEAVNILGSLFYGVILGLFLIAFFLKKVTGTPVFISAILAETLVIICFFFTNIPYLWYNVIGCIVMTLLAVVLQTLSTGWQKAT
ncbi:MAG: sodium:solute symporter [Holophagaceae bacterium]|nr:sodium:solute symporter [Holophagaceae bacterium]